MPIKIANRVVLNPTDSTHAALIQSLFHQKIEEIQAYRPYEFINPKTGELTEYTFTHTLYWVQKTQRENKPDTNYYAVCTPKELGKGAFGQVHTIEGMWKNETQYSAYKTKATLEKQRALKISSLNRSEELNDHRVLLFAQEYDIGRWTPHMGFKYPPTRLDKSVNLLMRKLQGETLEYWIEGLNHQTEHLSVTERLQISIQLLEKLHTQINGILLPADHELPNAYIVHQDLKPSNIMCNRKDLDYLDFGLAIPHTHDVRKLSVAGSDLWLDPFRYNTSNRKKTNRSTQNPTKVNDLASLARIIAELWGDTSRHLEISEDDLLKANEENITKGLCEHISELSADEQKALIDLIKTMTNYHEKDRLSREEALARFQGLLNTRISRLKKSIKGPLHLISADLLFEIVRSPVAEELFTRLKKQPHELPRVWNKLKPLLRELDEQSIRKLHGCGLNLSTQVITLEEIKAKTYTPEQISLLVELGATLEPKLLEEWYYYTRLDDKLYWAKMCRAIYQATQNSEGLLSAKPLNKTFESQFFTRFLTKKETAKDDETNVRLLQQHLQATAIEAKEIKLTQESLARIKSTPLSKAILASPLMKPTEELLLHKRSHFPSLNLEVTIFCTLITRVKALKPIAGQPQRNDAIARIQAEIERRQKLQDYTDWQTALDVNELNNEIACIEVVDSCYQRLGQIGDANAAARFQAELATAYQKLDTPSLNLLIKQCDALYLSYAELLKNINVTRAAIRVIQPRVLIRIDNELSELLDSASIKNSSEVYPKMVYLNTRCDYLYEHYVTPKKAAPTRSPTHGFFQPEAGQVVLDSDLDNQCEY